MANSCGLTVPLFLLSIGTQCWLSLLSQTGRSKQILGVTGLVTSALGLAWFYGGVARSFPNLAMAMIGLTSNIWSWYILFIVMLALAFGLPLLRDYIENQTDVVPVFPQMAITSPLERQRLGLLTLSREPSQFRCLSFRATANGTLKATCLCPGELSASLDCKMPLGELNMRLWPYPGLLDKQRR
jgi:hypothetical protein